MEIRAPIHAGPPTSLQPKMAPTLTEDALVLQGEAPRPAPPPTGAAIDAIPRFFGHLLEVRAEVQNLLESMGRLRQAATLADADARAAELGAALAEGDAIDRRNRAKIAGLLGRLRAILEGEARLYQWCADQIIHVENCWERAEYHLDRLRALIAEGRASDVAVLSAAIEVKARLERMIFLAAYLTIPQRVNEHLSQLRIGQALDFHRDFADELPEAGDRLKMLQTMRSHPNQIHGVVDVERGLIYKAAARRSRQALSLGLQVALLGAGVGVFAGLPALGAWPELGDRGVLVERYLFVALGALLHLSMSTLKQRRRGGEGELSALDDFLLWIHVREVSIAWTVLSVWVGAIGLSFVQPSASPEAALIVGYSLDSFIDVFLLRFEARTASVARALQGKG